MVLQIRPRLLWVTEPIDYMRSNDSVLHGLINFRLDISCLTNIILEHRYCVQEVLESGKVSDADSSSEETHFVHATDEILSFCCFFPYFTLFQILTNLNPSLNMRTARARVSGYIVRRSKRSELYVLEDLFDLVW